MTTSITDEQRRPAPPPPPKPPRIQSKAILLGVCCVAQFMVILDLGIVNVALPSIQVGLNFSSADLNWVVNAYAIVFGGLLMLAGRVGDVYGHRRTFVIALLVFSLASLLGGLAPTSLVLIIARGIQGLGGALMAATSLGIITANFAEGHERHRAIALWSAMNGLGGAVGVLLSGVITQYASWRWVLLINVPIGIVSISVAWAVVVDRRAAKRLRFDVAGALLLTVGLLVEAYGAVQAGNYGWGSATALVPLIVGFFMLNFFPLVEKRAAAPLVPLKAFTKPLRIVNGIIFLFSAAILPMWYIGSLYLQQVLNLSPIDTGLVFLPIAVVIGVCASQAGKLVSRAGVRPVLGCGLLLMTAGMYFYSRIGSGGSSIQYIMVPGILTAAGIGFSIVPSTIAATQAADPERAGLAAGLANSSRQIGFGLGLAVIISIATQVTSDQVGSGTGVPQALTHGFSIGYLIGAGLCAVAAVLTFIFVARMPGAERAHGRQVMAGALGLIVVFAAVEFIVPRTHAAPIGRYVVNADTWSFKSAPNLHPPKLQIEDATPGKSIPGDVMIANFYDVTKPPIVGQGGPLVLDGNMQPIWFRPVSEQNVASNLEKQTYEGQPALSWWQGNVTGTGEINTGEEVVVNQHYQTIATLNGRNGWILTLHAMDIVGHDAWVTANKNVPTNLSNEGGVNNGVLVQSAIQEYDLRTGKLLYTWNASDHIPLSQSKTQPPTNGFGYDAYHVNAVQLLSGDRMLVSMRNTSAVYLVDIKSGKILWTLGGKDSSFQIPANAHFEWQHDPQLVNADTVTMFDDHCCYITGAGVYLSATGPSRGLELGLNFQNHTARMVAQHYLFGTTVHSEYMGNMQTLPNGDRFVGWGQAPFFSLYSKTGKRLFAAALPAPDMSYRAYVQTWVGKPLYPPSGAATTSSGHTTVYASWNGATQVTSWKVLAIGSGAANAPSVVASGKRQGFETAIRVNSSAQRFEVQALNGAGKVLGTSKAFASG
ncbi:MAG: MFS transporter [Solirubrobacteraceae bacterium]